MLYKFIFLIKLKCLGSSRWSGGEYSVRSVGSRTGEFLPDAQYGGINLINESLDSYIHPTFTSFPFLILPGSGGERAICWTVNDDDALRRGFASSVVVFGRTDLI